MFYLHPLAIVGLDASPRTTLLHHDQSSQAENPSLRQARAALSSQVVLRHSLLPFNSFNYDLVSSHQLISL